MTVTDLTTYFVSAKQFSNEWKQFFKEYYKILLSNPSLKVMERDDIPEYWVGIGNEKKTFAILRTNLHLLFIVKELPKDIMFLANLPNIITVVIEDLDKQRFKIDEAVFFSIFPNFNFDTAFDDLFHPSNFTIGDLLYITD